MPLLIFINKFKLKLSDDNKNLLIDSVVTKEPPIYNKIVMNLYNKYIKKEGESKAFPNLFLIF